jgi:hypothetical protein
MRRRHGGERMDENEMKKEKRGEHIPGISNNCTTLLVKNAREGMFVNNQGRYADTKTR